VKNVDTVDKNTGPKTKPEFVKNLWHNLSKTYPQKKIKYPQMGNGIFSALSVDIVEN